MKNNAARRVALTGMLFALAIVLGWAEGLLAPLLGLPPGVKLGLANIAVMYALFYLSAGQALLLVVLKAGFGLLTRGAVAGALSLAGGLCALLVMALLGLFGPWLARRRAAAKAVEEGATEAAGTAEKATAAAAIGPSLFILSIAGALAHNAGQLLVVRLMLGPFSLYYAPVLILAGVAAGSLTALSVRALAPALARAGLARRM